MSLLEKNDIAMKCSGKFTVANRPNSREELYRVITSRLSVALYLKPSSDE